MCLKTAGRDDFEETYDQIENATKTLMTTISAFASRPPPEAELKSSRLTNCERYAVRQLREAIAREQTRQDQTKSSPDIDGLEDFAAAFGLTISANNVALWEPTKLAVRDTHNRGESFDAVSGWASQLTNHHIVDCEPSAGLPDESDSTPAPEVLKLSESNRLPLRLYTGADVAQIEQRDTQKASNGAEARAVETRRKAQEGLIDSDFTPSLEARAVKVYEGFPTDT